MAAPAPTSADPERIRSDGDRVAAHVARAWTETSLSQSQFGLELARLASGYATAPEMERAATASGDYAAVPTADLRLLLSYAEAEVANGRYGCAPRLRDAVARLRRAVGGPE